MKRLIFILSFFAALFPFTAHAASTAPYVPLSVPTSPQAAAFKMYGDVAVNPAMGARHIYSLVRHRSSRLSVAFELEIQSGSVPSRLQL